MLATMGSLFVELARRAPANARREVEAHTRRVPGFALLERSPRARSRTMEHLIWLRRRSVELGPEEEPLDAADLARISSMGELRAGAGLSLDARQRLLHVHTSLVLREIDEASEADPGAVDELVGAVGWFAAQSARGIAAYRRGFLRALRGRLPYTEQLGLLTRSLLRGDPLSAELARAVDMDVPDRCAVTVFRLPERPVVDRLLENEIGTLAKSHRAPVMWGTEREDGSGELIALLPLSPEPAHPPGSDARETRRIRTDDADPGPCGPGRTSARPGAPVRHTREDGATEVGGAPQEEGDAEAPLVPRREATGGGAGEPLPEDPALERLRPAVGDFARVLGRPCAVGTVPARPPRLAEALERARRISRSAPARRASAPPRPHTLADVFVELAVADVPFVEDWLCGLARRLESGPDLLVTLDAYYRHDMRRRSTASALNIHTRTLDYRLRRARELTGIDPGSTRGVRTLSAVVTRRGAGAWG
ncbi:helix-turn-helix domain-containing protein [Streptomyces sp. ZYX-F-203]